MALRKKVEDLEADIKASNEKYQKLLQNTTMQSMAKMNQEVSFNSGPKVAGMQARSVDIQLVGAQSVGKTSLLEAYTKEFDPPQLAKIQTDKQNTGNFLGRYQIQFQSDSSDSASASSSNVKINFLDCSGNPRAQQHIKEYFTRALWVFVIYDICSLESYASAKELLKQAHAAGCRVLFFGNKYSLEQGGQAAVDIMMAKDTAASVGALAVEGSELKEAIRMVAKDIQSEHQALPATKGS